MEDGIRFGNFFCSYSSDEEHNCIGVEIGVMTVPSLDDSAQAKTFALVFKLSHFVFAIGYILKEFWNELNFWALKTLTHFEKGAIFEWFWKRIKLSSLKEHFRNGKSS